MGEDVQIPLFQLSDWCEKCVAAWHYAMICKQLLISNDRNRVRWVVLGLSEDEACTDVFENLSVNSLKVHKIENVFGSDFEFCVISLLVMVKY